MGSRANYKYKLLAIAKDVQEGLKNDYNIIYGEYKDYRGLCNEACYRFEREINKRLGDSVYHLAIRFIHGEQKHRFSINPDYWVYEHTWCMVTINEYRFYVDLTLSQFKFIYGDMPSIYVTPMPPRWFLSDEKNLYWVHYNTKWLRKLIYAKDLLWYTFCKFVNQFKPNNS